MTAFRNNCIKWGKKTYSESLNQFSNLDPKLSKKVANCFNKLELTDKPVNGYSVEKLPKTEEGTLGVRTKYTDVFHSLLTKNVFDPTNYLIELTKQYFENNGADEKLYGFIARGLRTLASFLREPDFAEILLNNLVVSDKNTSVDLSPLQDAGNHTDVLLTYKNVQYRIWLFQFSDRGLPHDIERITGKRGALPQGTHVLCPLHTKPAAEYDKLRKSIDRLAQRINKSESSLENCSNRAIKKKQKLLNNIANCSTQRKAETVKLKNAKSLLANELDIIEGWYFYSPPHIERIANQIIQNTAPFSYKKVVNILTAPEQFLTNVQIFKID